MSQCCNNNTCDVTMCHTLECALISQSHRTYEGTATTLQLRFSNIRPITLWLCSNGALNSPCFCICCSGLAWLCNAVTRGHKCCEMFKSSQCDNFIAMLSQCFRWPFALHLHASQCCVVISLASAKLSQRLLHIGLLSWKTLRFRE